MSTRSGHLPRRSGLTLLLSFVGAAAATAALIPASSSADCCMGPPVMVVLKHWAPLTTTLTPTVRTDDPDRTFSATIRADLKVGDHLIARLDTVTVTNLKETTPTKVTFKVSQHERDAAARYGVRTHHRHGIVTFVVRAIDQNTGQPAWAHPIYGQDAFVTLPRPRR